MNQSVRVALAAAHLELKLFRSSRAFLVCTLLGAINFLVLVSLFGLTGSRAPTAIINNDHGLYADDFIQALDTAHHSFRLLPMTAASADAALRSGRLVAAITIPAGFSHAVANRDETTLDVRIDNVNVDLTDDVQRAIPSAIVAFAKQQSLPNIRVRTDEHDLLRTDTGYIPYLVVSGLALDALVLAGVLGAVVVARDWEGRTSSNWKLWRLSPASTVAMLLGKLSAAALLATIAVAIAALVAVFGYRLIPISPIPVAATLLACVVIFTCLGGLLGAIVRRSQIAVPLVFGLAMPFYLNSGALEPSRFDGDLVWGLAHLSPLYYAIAALQRTYHGLRVAPEPIIFHFFVLAAAAALGLAATRIVLSRAEAR